jgi:hypothetical protein
VDKEEVEPASSALLDKKLIGGSTTNSVAWLQTVASKHDDTEMDRLLGDQRTFSCLNIIDEDHYVRGVKALNVMKTLLHHIWYQCIWNEIRSYL